MTVIQEQLELRVAWNDPGPIKPICIRGKKGGGEVALFVVGGYIVGGWYAVEGEDLVAWGLTP